MGKSGIKIGKTHLSLGAIAVIAIALIVIQVPTPFKTVTYTNSSSTMSITFIQNSWTGGIMQISPAAVNTGCNPTAGWKPLPLEIIYVTPPQTAGLFGSQLQNVPTGYTLNSTMTIPVKLNGTVSNGVYTFQFADIMKAAGYTSTAYNGFWNFKVTNGCIVAPNSAINTGQSAQIGVSTFSQLPPNEPLYQYIMQVI